MSRDANDWMEGGAKVEPFKFANVGDVVVGVIVDTDVMQCRDYETGKPEWRDEDKTEPKEQLVVTLQTDPAVVPRKNADDDGKRRIYAKKPGEMLTAILGVTHQKGHRLEIGGKLVVKFSGTRPHENPRLNDIKLFEAGYQPPAEPSNVAALLGGTPENQPPQAAAEQAPTAEAPASAPAGTPAAAYL